ncbi:hypothetical protein MJO28_009147 [Puccinia striiformis f. sp. tritici]|uniref:Uncharacterized protein n=1 Tax=Puccinia striiformis f. sp. tritici TaxID=168172 RepID=A0ACC0E891_9BASI|nr:hypothetical protein MJO28_009147 [Puccinia striiformis f. sp. tritici]
MWHRTSTKYLGDYLVPTTGVGLYYLSRQECALLTLFNAILPITIVQVTFKSSGRESVRPSPYMPLLATAAIGKPFFNVDKIVSSLDWHRGRYHFNCLAGDSDALQSPTSFTHWTTTARYQKEPNSNSENDIMQPDNGESTLKGEVPTNHCIIALDDFPIINPSQRSTDMERMVWSLRHVGEYDDNGELPDWLNKTEHSDLKSFVDCLHLNTMS